MLTKEYLKELFNYDPVSGVLTWKIKKAIRVKEGDVAGSPTSEGYLSVSVDGKTYLAHKLIWLLVTGDWPKGELDHKDGITCNNAWLNLRESTKSQNQANRVSNLHSSSKYKGVSYQKDCNKWKAVINCNKKRYYLGLFLTEEEAAMKYNEQAVIHFGEYARLNTIHPAVCDEEIVNG